jgi:hypothetical protein
MHFTLTEEQKRGFRSQLRRDMRALRRSTQARGHLCGRKLHFALPNELSDLVIEGHRVYTVVGKGEDVDVTLIYTLNPDSERDLIPAAPVSVHIRLFGGQVVDLEIEHHEDGSNSITRISDDN